MDEGKPVSVREFQGYAVIATDTGEKLGEVADLLVHPTEGTIVGVVMKAGEETHRAISVDQIRFGPDALMAAAGAGREGSMPSSIDGIPADGELVGTNVVADDGRLIGRVSDVYVSIDRMRTVYKVAESKMKGLFGMGFYISGDLPTVYSSDGVRMLVPADTEELHSSESAAEALATSGRATPE